MFFHPSDKCKKLAGGILCLVLLLLLFSSNFKPVLNEDSTEMSRVENNPSGPSEVDYYQTRYGNRILEDFNNWTNIDKEKTDSSFRTLESRVYLWGCSPVIPPEYTGMINQNTHSHGGGFSPKYNEYWYPQWSGTTINRYDLNGNYLGQFNSGDREIMQLWGDKDGTYYTANYGRYYIYKWSDMGSNQIWSYHLGNNYYDRGSGVCCDDEFVYAIKYNSQSIIVLNKTNGQFVRSISLPQNTYCYGGLAYANDLLYVSGYANDRQRVGIFTAENGTYQGSFQSQVGIYNMAYNGEEYCVSSNNNNVHKYKISDGNSYIGNDIEPPTNITHIQSKILTETTQTIGAARMTWYEHKPAGTDIEYRLTADGKNWVKMQNNTHHVFVHQGAPLRWNATLKTDNKSISPYMDKIIIEYDLVGVPEPTGPDSDLWQGTSTPMLEWYFKDPDKFDHQSDYLVEVFTDQQMNTCVYNSTWTNSTVSKHTLTRPLDDGVYYWRARTADSYHARGNWSGLKKFMIDTTKPVGSIVIEEGAITVNDQLANLEIGAMDNASGVAEMQIMSDRGSFGPWEEYHTGKRIALTPTDGIKTVGVRFRDHAGIVSEIFNDSVYLDLLGPWDVGMFSPTHPDPTLYYNSTDPVFQWVPPYEKTALKGYSYLVDNSGHTDPVKVLNVENGDISGTAPGEFEGLSDGKWYFHIIPCDIFDQWGNTTHYRFNIDCTDPVITKLTPDAEEWYTVNELRAEVVFEDGDGFGLDPDSIMYSHKKAGGSFSDWTTVDMQYDIMLRTINENPVKIKAWIDIPLLEGDDNTIKWRISDIAGNGPLVSEEVAVKVDVTPLNFSSPVPSEADVSNENTVSVGITMSDTGGSGVDGKTIQYCISNSGDDPGSFINWTPVNYDKVDESIDVFEAIVFEPGVNNYIKWRAKDVAGNGFIESSPYRVWVNSEPVPVIHRPSKNAVYELGESIPLNASGSYDNENDELSYYWEIENATTKRTYFTYSGMSTEAELEKTGKYNVYLHVYDGRGFNESKKISIEVVPEGTGGNGGTGSGGAGGSKQGAMSSWIWLVLIILVVIAASVVAVVVIARKKEAEAKTRKQKPQVPYRTQGPYGFDTMEYQHPRYSDMSENNQVSSIHQYPASSAYGWGAPMPAAGVLPQAVEGVDTVREDARELPTEEGTIVAESEAEDMEIDVDSFKLAPLPSLDLSGLDSADKSETEYMLPSSTSGGGVEIKALPPATVEETDVVDVEDSGEKSEDEGGDADSEEKSGDEGGDADTTGKKDSIKDDVAEKSEEKTSTDGAKVDDPSVIEKVEGEGAAETTSEGPAGKEIVAKTGDVPKEVKTSVKAKETISEGSSGEEVVAQAEGVVEEVETSTETAETTAEESSDEGVEDQSEDGAEEVETSADTAEESSGELSEEVVDAKTDTTEEVDTSEGDEEGTTEK